METMAPHHTVCPKCGIKDKQIKKGKTHYGSGQRMFCNVCKYKYTPIKKGYDEEFKQDVVDCYMLGYSARKVGEKYGIDGKTVVAWVASANENLQLDDENNKCKKEYAETK